MARCHPLQEPSKARVPNSQPSQTTHSPHLHAPAETTPAPCRKEADVLEHLSRTQENLSSTGESCLLTSDGAFKIPIAFEVEINEEMAKAEHETGSAGLDRTDSTGPTSAKTSSTDVNPENTHTTNSERDCSNVDTSPYPSQMLHLWWLIQNSHTLVIDALTKSQKTVGSLKTEVSPMRQTFHILQRQSNCIEAMTRGTTPPRINNNTNNNNTTNTNTTKNGNNNPNNSNNNNKEDKTGNKEEEKVSYTKAAANANSPNNNNDNKNHTFTKVQKKKPTSFFNNQTPGLDLQVRIDSTQPINGGITNDQILEVVNRATVPQISSFCSARRTTNGSITLETSLTSSAKEGVAYSQEIASALEIIDSSATKRYANTRMSQLVIHGVPSQEAKESTAEEMDEIAQEIRAVTSFGLAVTSKWLAHPEGIRKQSNGSIIVTLPGKVGILGIRYMTLFNRSSRVEKARLKHQLTRCRKYRKIGHHQDRCEAPPKCGVCTIDHMTEDHKCFSKTCLGGHRCTHTLLRCVNCLPGSTPPWKDQVQRLPES